MSEKEKPSINDIALEMTNPDDLEELLKKHPLYKYGAYKSDVQKVYLAAGIKQLQKRLDNASSDTDKIKLGKELAVLRELRRLGSKENDH